MQRRVPLSAGSKHRAVIEEHHADGIIIIMRSKTKGGRGEMIRLHRPRLLKHLRYQRLIAFIDEQPARLQPCQYFQLGAGNLQPGAQLQQMRFTDIRNNRYFRLGQLRKQLYFIAAAHPHF
ncbi:hypothetical protein D3C77_393220 [compost metagenome]